MATTGLDLFRSVRKDAFPEGVVVDDHAVAGVLYPSFKNEEYVVNVGRRAVTKTRDADILPYKHEGEDVVDAGAGGTSLFDKSGVFGAKHWYYFTIPSGTTVPDSLVVRHTGRNDRYDAEHYQIEVAGGRMTVAAFKGALDNLARNAIATAYANR